MSIPPTATFGYMSPYISKVEKFRSRNEKIGPVARTILRYFITAPPLSVSDILRKMKPTGNWSAYKNVHKRVRRLSSLNLITRDKNYKSKRGEIKYKLTSEGIFHLLLNSMFYFSDDLKGFFVNYGDDDFFKQFIYPYLSKETILNMSDEVFFIDLSENMRDICYQINATLDYENESRKLDTNPRAQVADEPPLKRVNLYPLGLSIIFSCKYLGNRDLLLLSRDVRFMKELSKRLNELESTRRNLLGIRGTA